MRIKLDEKIATLFQVEDVESWVGCMVTATPHKVRVRRPAPDTVGEGQP